MIQNAPIIESVITFKLDENLEITHTINLDINFNQIYS